MVVDDFLRYLFVSFLREKLEVIKHLKSLFNRIQMDISHPIVRIRSDRGEKEGEQSLRMWMLTSFVNKKELNMNF